MACKKFASRKTAVIILLVAVFLFVSSVVILICFPLLYNKILYQKIALVNNSMLYGLWRDLPLPIYERLYFFNITNEEAFLANKEKLNVTQVGPYTYTATWKKHNIQWHPNKTITYQEMRTYQFSPNDSSGTEEDEIFTLNGPFVIAANHLKDSGATLQRLASFILYTSGEKVIIKKSIKELAYQGYEDFIIKYGGILIPKLPFKNGIFSWLYDKNATYDGQFTVFTGEDDIQKLNKIDTWNGQKNLTFWQNDTCNMINGSSAEVNAPLTENQQELTFFQSFFCRSLTFSSNHEEVEHKGIRAKRFIATSKIFANATDNENNYCFATKPLRSGLQDVSTCQFGAPAFLSFPHFYLADSYYSDAITGLSPNGSDYTSYIDVEPTTGVSVAIKLNFQLSIEMNRVAHFWQFENVPEGFFPILWAEIKVSLTDELANFFKSSLNEPKTITYSVLGVMVTVAIVLMIVSIIILIKLKRESRNLERDDVDPIYKSDDSLKSKLSNGEPYSTQFNDRSNFSGKPLSRDNSSASSSVTNSPPQTTVNPLHDDDDVSLLDCKSDVMKKTS